MTGDLVLVEQPQLPGLELTAIGARVTGPHEPDALVDALTSLRRAEAAWNWIAADLVLELIAEHGHATALQQVAALDLSQAHLARCIAVATRVPFERRRPELTWSHHEAVARCDDDTQTIWLDRAVTGGWSVRHLADMIADSVEPDDELDLDPKPLVVKLPTVARASALLAGNPGRWLRWQPATGALELDP